MSSYSTYESSIKYERRIYETADEWEIPRRDTPGIYELDIVWYTKAKALYKTHYVVVCGKESFEMTDTSTVDLRFNKLAFGGVKIFTGYELALKYLGAKIPNFMNND